VSSAPRWPPACTVKSSILQRGTTDRVHIGHVDGDAAGPGRRMAPPAKCRRQKGPTGGDAEAAIFKKTTSAAVALRGHTTTSGRARDERTRRAVLERSSSPVATRADRGDPKCALSLGRLQLRCAGDTGTSVTAADSFAYRARWNARLESLHERLKGVRKTGLGRVRCTGGKLAGRRCSGLLPSLPRGADAGGNSDHRLRTSLRRAQTTISDGRSISA